MPAKKPDSSRSSLDPVNRETSAAAYNQGFAARGHRVAVEACPYGDTDPFRLIWQAGWHAARIAEADCSALLHSLHRAGLTTALLDLDPLDDQQRFTLIDWLESRPDGVTSNQTFPWQQFLARRPPWVTITGQAVPAEDDQPELIVIAFDLPRQSLCLQALTHELLQSGLNTGNDPIRDAANACGRGGETLLLDGESKTGHAPGMPLTAAAGTAPSPANRSYPVTETLTRPTSHHSLSSSHAGRSACEAHADLRDLLRDFDDIGVQLVEEQWQSLGDADQHLCTRWLRGRLQGIMSPVPYCLIPFATMQLKAEYAPYIDECRPTRSERLPITFDKPGVIAAGDDDEGKIKLIVKAPYEHMPGALADHLFRDTACRIHFSTRRPSQWNQQELFAAHPIYVTQSDIKGYKATRADTSFSFTVDQQTLSIESAFKHLWGHPGTAIVERIGRATREPKAQHATT